MDKRLSRKHLMIMREYVKTNFKEYYTFALRKFRIFYEKQCSLEESKYFTEIEIEKYRKKDILDRISEFNKTGKVKKRNYTPRAKKQKAEFGYEYKYIKIIFD